MNDAPSHRWQRIGLAAFFAVVNLLFFMVLKRAFSGVDWSVFSNHFFTLLTCVGFSLVYSIVSAVNWKIICDSQNISFTLRESFKIICVSSLIDVVVFPSRISSDVYRASRLKDRGIRTGVQVTAAYRVGKIIPFLILTPLLLIKDGAIPGKSLLFIVALLAIGGYLVRKAPQLTPFWKPLLIVLALNTLLLLTEYTRTYLLLSLFHPFDYQHMLTSFLLSNSAGAASGIPLGLGAKDVSWGLLLKSTLTPAHLALFLLLLRLTGELFNALLGWIFSGRKILTWIKNGGYREQE